MGQWSDGPSGMWSGAGMEGKIGGGNPAMGMWDEAMKNQASHRNIGLKNSRSSPSLRYTYLRYFEQAVCNINNLTLDLNQCF